MPQLGKFLHKSRTKAAYLYWCPACDHAHVFDCEPPRGWTFDNNLEFPTFQPSMLEYLPATSKTPQRTLCHHFVTNGQIHYLDDCPHEYRGKTVPMVPVEEHADYGWGDS